jgi:hypothetical protein
MKHLSGEESCKQRPQLFRGATFTPVVGRVQVGGDFASEA